VLVVSDTSPLRALQAIELVPVLEPLYGRVLVPPAVSAELAAPSPRVQPFNVETFPFLVVRQASRIAPNSDLIAGLGLGEQQAIALAMEVGASTLLIDDGAARRAARACGVATTGVIGVLVEAKGRGLIVQLAPLIAQLRERIAFRLSERVVREALRAAGEA
jgi:uncharacterized protein